MSWNSLWTAAAILAFGQLTLQADDWPEFRGPSGQGHYEGELLSEWSPNSNVAWKQAIPGSGWSSPVAVGGKVYLTTAVPAAQGMSDELSLRVLCLDAATGKTLWDREAFLQDSNAPAIHSKNSHASPTPIIRDGRIYVHFGHQGTACLDCSGKVIWKNTANRYSPVHGNGGSPILVDELLVFSCDGGDQAYITALDSATGKQRWRTDRRVEADRSFSFSTPLLIHVKGKKQIVSPCSNAVIAYEPESGKEIWRVAYDGYSVIPRPVHAHGLVFVCTGYNSPTLLAIRPDGEGDVTGTHIAWQARRGAPHAPSLLVVGDELYMVSDGGVASCLDARTGKVHWQERLGGNYSASPLHAGDKIYFQSEDGLGTVIQASKTFKRLARNAMGERTLASYAAADGALFLRTAKHLYRLQPK